MGGPSFHAHFAELISELVASVPPPHVKKPKPAATASPNQPLLDAIPAAVAPPPLIKNENLIPRVSKLSMEEFYKTCMLASLLLIQHLLLIRITHQTWCLLVR